MDPVSMLGAVAASITLAQVLHKTVSKVVELHGGIKHAPRQTQKQLVLQLIQLLSQLEQQHQSNASLRTASLAEAIQDCRGLLDGIRSELEAWTPASGDGKRRKLIKAISAFWKRDDTLKKFEQLKAKIMPLHLALASHGLKISANIQTRVEATTIKVDDLVLIAQSNSQNIQTTVHNTQDILIKVDNASSLLETNIHNTENIQTVVDDVKSRSLTIADNTERTLIATESISRSHGDMTTELAHVDITTMKTFETVSRSETQIAHIGRRLDSLDQLSPSHTKAGFGLILGSAPLIKDFSCGGRSEELERLRCSFVEPRTSRTVLVISGPGGIGKTHLAVHFAKVHKSLFSSIFWLNARSESTLKESFLFLQRYIFGAETTPVCNPDDVDQAIKKVLVCLSKSQDANWLLIFDNYDDPRLPGTESPTGFDIQKYFPEGDEGSILITTRSTRLTFARQMELPTLKHMDAYLMLTVLADLEIVGDEGADTLVESLGGFPLALATAAAHLRHSTLTCQQYLHEYEENWQSLKERSEQLPEYHNGTLFTTWDTSLQKIKAQCPSSVQLLRLMAYFDRKDMWFELFQAGVPGAPDWFQNVMKTRVEFEQAMAKLQDMSLVEIRNNRYSMHKCIQDWCLKGLNHGYDNEVFRLALRCLLNCIPEPDNKASWKLEHRLRPHAMRLKMWTPKILALSSGQELYRLGYLFESQGLYKDAEPIYLIGYQRGIKTLGKSHIETTRFLDRLGNIYQHQFITRKAELCHRLSVSRYEKIWNPTHPDVLNATNKLGQLFYRQEKLDDAEKLYNRALTRCEKAEGIGNPSALAILRSLGHVYFRQGRIEEAEETLQRALTGHKKVGGPARSDQYDVMHSLAEVYHHQGKAKEAEEMYTSAYLGYKRMYGLGNPDALEIAGDLANLYRDHDKTEKAEQMLKTVLTGMLKVRLLYHPQVAQILYDLGALYEKQGKFAVAFRVWNDAHTSYANSLTPIHPLTLDTWNRSYCFPAEFPQEELFYDPGHPPDEVEALDRILSGECDFSDEVLIMQLGHHKPEF